MRGGARHSRNAKRGLAKHWLDRVHEYRLDKSRFDATKPEFNRRGLFRSELIFGAAGKQSYGHSIGESDADHARDESFGCALHTCAFTRRWRDSSFDVRISDTRATNVPRSDAGPEPGPALLSADHYLFSESASIFSGKKYNAGISAKIKNEA
jgi:hypothetical protein